MEKVVYSLVLLAGYVIHSQAQCDSGWLSNVTIDTNCYRFVKAPAPAPPDKPPNPSTFQVARRVCQDTYGGDLLMITEQKLNDWIRDQMVKQRMDRIWLGLQETHHEWKWISDGTPVEHQGCYSRQELERTARWNNFGAATALQDPVKCIADCQRDGYSYAGIQYFSASQIQCSCSRDFNPLKTQTLSGCNSYCPSTPDKEDENVLRCGSADSSNKMLVFKTGSGGNDMLNHWYYNQPNNFDFYQSCMVMARNEKFKFGDEKCYKDNGMNHICEYSTVGCSREKRIVSDRCISTHFNGYSWYTSAYDCKKRGGALVKIDNRAFWKDLQKDGQVAAGGLWWVGGYQSGWQWVNGQALEYDNWAPEQPDQHKEKCAALYKNTAGFKKYQWEDRNCSESNDYVCMKSIPTTTTTVTTPTTTVKLTTRKATTPKTKPTTPTRRPPVTTPKRGTPTTTRLPGSTPKRGSVATPPPPTAPSAKPTSQAVPKSTSAGAEVPTTAESGGVGGEGGEQGEQPFYENKGIIIAIVIAGVAVLAAFIRLLVFCCQRRSGDDTEKLAA